MQKTIVVTTQFIPLAGGFWAFLGENGEKWRPFPPDFPQELKKDGIKLELSAELLPDAVSFVMWGEEIDIISYRLL